MRGHAQDVQVAVADLEHEQDVEPPQCHRAVDVEEVDRQHAGGLRAQELPPVGVGVPGWRGWDHVALENPTDRRGADSMGQFEQFTLDPPVPLVFRSFLALSLVVGRGDTPVTRGSWTLLFVSRG